MTVQTESRREVIQLTRDTIALMVPSGARIMLHEGTEVTITQALGSTYTVDVYGNLARIEGQDADALGKEPTDTLGDLPDGATLEEKVWAMLGTCFDPEIPVSIVALGLIYKCELLPVEGDMQDVLIDMTLTAPGCGMGPVIAAEAKDKIESIPGVHEAQIEIVFDPPWDREMMSDEARLELGMF